MSTTELKNLIASLLVGHEVGSGVYQKKRYKATKKYPKGSVYAVRPRTLANKIPNFGVRDAMTVARLEQADPKVRGIRAIYANPAYEQYYPEVIKTQRSKTTTQRKKRQEGHARTMAKAHAMAQELAQIAKKLREQKDKPRRRVQLQTKPTIEFLAEGIKPRRRRVAKRRY